MIVVPKRSRNLIITVSEIFGRFTHPLGACNFASGGIEKLGVAVENVIRMPTMQMSDDRHPIFFNTVVGVAMQAVCRVQALINRQQMRQRFAIAWPGQLTVSEFP